MKQSLQIKELKENHCPFDVFIKVTNIGGLIAIMNEQNNLYVEGNSSEFCTDAKKMMAFLEWII